MKFTYPCYLLPIKIAKKLVCQLICCESCLRDTEYQILARLLFIHFNHDVGFSKLDISCQLENDFKCGYTSFTKSNVSWVRLSKGEGKLRSFTDIEIGMRVKLKLKFFIKDTC